MRARVTALFALFIAGWLWLAMLAGREMRREEGPA